MGAAFLCQIAALDTFRTLQNSTAYIGSRPKALKDNPMWVLKASKQARLAPGVFREAERKRRGVLREEVLLIAVSVRSSSVRF